ncbi:MAG: hypothetical protein AVDCRST_MAG13-2549, partial [uncultured Solirubrobacteraceae bacterium]
VPPLRTAPRRPGRARRGLRQRARPGSRHDHPRRPEWHRARALPRRGRGPRGARRVAGPAGPGAAHRDVHLGPGLDLRLPLPADRAVPAHAPRARRGHRPARGGGQGPGRELPRDPPLAHPGRRLPRHRPARDRARGRAGPRGPLHPHLRPRGRGRRGRLRAARGVRARRRAGLPPVPALARAEQAAGV